MSTEQFDYVLGLVGPYILRLPTVYVAVYVQGRTIGTYDVVRIVRRRTSGTTSYSYVAVRRRTYKSAQKSSMSRFIRFTTTASYDVACSVNAADTLHVFD